MAPTQALTKQYYDSQRVFNSLVNAMKNKEMRDVIMTVCSYQSKQKTCWSSDVSKDTGIDQKNVDSVLYELHVNNLIENKKEEPMGIVANPRIKLITGRPASLKERAPSFENKILRDNYTEYRHFGEIVNHIRYLISDQPINEAFWRRATYCDLYFGYEGKELRLLANHGSQNTMREVIKGNLDISEWILDLTKMSGHDFHMPDGEYKREEFMAFKQEVQKKLEPGIKKLLVKEFVGTVN
jgi:hypothetical protein